MSLLTTDDVTGRGIGASLSTFVLQGIIDDEEAELVRRFGANREDAPITETVQGGCKSLGFRRALESVTSVVEYAYLGDTAPLTLVANTDYYVWPTEGRIERLGQHWGPAVRVVYTPVDDTALRRNVLLELIRVAVSQNVLASETKAVANGPTHSMTYASGGDWNRTRERLYNRLGGPSA